MSIIPSLYQNCYNLNWKVTPMGVLTNWKLRYENDGGTADVQGTDISTQWVPLQCCHNYTNTAVSPVNTELYDEMHTKAAEYLVDQINTQVYSNIWSDYKVHLDNGEQAYTWQTECSPPVVVTVSERLRQVMAERHSPAILIRKSTRLEQTVDVREKRARELLRNIVGEAQYQNFLRRGTVSVRGPSGRVYCIQPGHGITTVYHAGHRLARLCVVLEGQFPPTDALVARLLMILGDEESFWCKANITMHNGAFRPPEEVWRPLLRPDLQFEPPVQPTEAVSRADVLSPQDSLVDIYRKLKAQYDGRLATTPQQISSSP